MYADYAAPMMAMPKGKREETKKGSKKALVCTKESDRAFEGMKQTLLSQWVCTSSIRTEGLSCAQTPRSTQ